jgi:hypothetical protein
MAKVIGKDLEFWFNGVEVPVISIGLSEAFDTLDSTDSATATNGKDFEVNRAARSFTVEALLYEPLGAEIATGNLVVGNTYQVTAKDSVLAAYQVGQIFTAESALTMSATDKVKPLGDKVTGKTMAFNNGSDVPLVSADISIKYDSLDVTDTETSGDGSETIVSRAERESKITMIVRDDEADLLTTNPVAESVTLTFASGQTVVGSAIPVSKNIADEAVGFAKVDYAFKWKGAPVETALGIPIDGEEDAFKIILRRGATGNKEYTGNAILTEKTISAEIKGITKISYSFMINGAVTPDEYSA